MKSIIDIIKNPADVKKLDINQLKKLSTEIREFLIKSISETGGHIGANLGVIELTIAMHSVFDDKDQILFDTGHQGYTHKILTGRKNMFKTLNKQDGMSRFLSNKESKYDILDASHAGTAISIATGIAQAKKYLNDGGSAVALVGDGALVEGMSLEGLNFGTAKELPLVIIINDNGMAISPNVGGIKNLFSGDDWEIKSKSFFEGLGYNYFAVQDGHNLEELISVFENVKKDSKNKSCVVHVKTEKGKGLEIAKDNKYKLHFSMPFNPVSGEGISPTTAGKTFATVAGDKLYDLMKKNEKMVVITPSTPYASGLDQCLEEFPDRTIDVGMAEQQAAGMAVGFAIQNYNPFVCYQSTFMQRAFDQLIHDIAYMNLPITVMAVRSGFSGFDSPTHHGIYDYTYLSAIPNMKVFYPGTSKELEKMIEIRSHNPEGPMVILYPYDPVGESEKEIIENNDIINPEIIFKSNSAYIITTGNCLENALEAKKLLKEDGLDIGLINLRWINPFPVKWIINNINKADRIISIEESILDGGIGSKLSELIADNKLNIELLRIGIPNSFVKPGNKEELSKIYGLDSKSIADKIKDYWKK